MRIRFRSIPIVRHEADVDRRILSAVALRKCC